MNTIRFTGSASVFRRDDNSLETSKEVLERLHGFVFDETRFTDDLGYLEDETGEYDDENAVAELLEPGGFISFEYSEAKPYLVAITEYKAKRLLTDEELGVLTEYTIGQWSDGIGGNLIGVIPRDLDVSIDVHFNPPPSVCQT